MKKEANTIVTIGESRNKLSNNFSTCKYYIVLYVLYGVDLGTVMD